MSRADEMLLERGFKVEIDMPGKLLYKDLDKNYIEFDTELNLFTCNCYLTIQELQAINEKCKELGWI